jgi:hypothetical protein
MTLKVMNGPSKRMFWLSRLGRWPWFGNGIGSLVETLGSRVGLDDVAPLGTKSFLSGSSAVDNVGLVKSICDFDSHTLPPYLCGMSDVTKKRGGKRRQYEENDRFVRRFFSGTSDSRIRWPFIIAGETLCDTAIWVWCNTRTDNLNADLWFRRPFSAN